MCDWPWKPEELEAVCCDLCGKSDTRPVIQRADGLTAVECQSCGLCFLNPRPPARLVARFYEATYFRKANPDSQPGQIGYPDYLSDEYRRFMLQTARLRLETVEPYLTLPGARSLEIGCATGEFCDRLSRHGALPLGIDLSEYAIQQARQRYPKLTFQVGALDTLPEKPAYDAIFAFEVIEHVISPKEFFSQIVRRLEPGGVLILSTPNYDCGRRLGVERWSGFLLSLEHLYFFNSASLVKYGHGAQLEVCQWYTDSGDGLVPAPNPPPQRGLRRMIHSCLHRTHLMKPAVRIRSFLRGTGERYSPQGSGHNLLMVFKRKP